MSRRSANTRKEAETDTSGATTDSRTAEGNLFGSRLVRSSPEDAHRSVGGQALIVTSGDGTIIEVLQSPEIANGDAPSSLIGGNIDEVWPGEPAGRLTGNVKRAIRSRRIESSEYWTEADDSYHDFVFIPNGPDRVMVVARDVSDRKTAFTRMERLAYLDEVTKLPNKQFLCEELDRCMNILRLQEGRAAVICFDVRSADGQDSTENAKQHETILVELASRLTHELRGANALDIDDYERYSVAARTDHSQFGVILPLVDSGEEAEGVAKRLIDTLQQPIKMSHRNTSVSVRAGIALFPQDGSDAKTLYDNAVTAMEDARNDRATTCKLHSGTVRLRALQRQDLESELRVALERDEFAIEFLPIAEADSRTITTVEALLRWPQAAFGPQSIPKVISMAENTGLILPIGDWVLRRSCEALKRWHENGWPELRVSVNLSIQEFSLDDLAERIRDVLDEYAVDPSFLEVEITEYALFRDAMKGYVSCSALKSLGVTVVVDDYGTGACSLAHVARSPVDAIKIDNSFVSNAVSDSSDRAACIAITAMARSLGKRIIAEGVETEAQAKMLEQQGCDALQGFAICKPTSIEGIDELLARGDRE